MSTPFALAAYRAAGHALEPFASLWLALRSRSGKEDPARVPERFGHAALPRPDGPLVWMHGASVGETRVLMSVRDGLAARSADLNFLITTGTRTSAAVVAADRHPRTRHQFAPLDRDGPARRFLDHWRPDLGVFAESEVWPNLILEAARRGVPLALINASMGARSLASWARAPRTAATVFSAFRLMLAADSATARGLEKLAGRPVPAAGNLKLAAGAPAPDPDELAAWRAALAGRPLWLAASTHEGEEELALAAHAALRGAHPGALLLIAPRHPERGDAVAALAGAPPRRSRGQRPTRDDPVFLVDTLGELGLFYALAPVAFVGGSLLAGLEGHNPVEPTRAGAAVITGPFVVSFQEIYDALAADDAAIEVNDAATLGAAVARLWADEGARARQVEAARAAIDRASPGLDRTVADLLALMPAVHARA
jgi:3-deoxy-D-manno-octulosonic-acid transferase